MYCLRHTNQTLLQNQGAEVPLVMFADMNRDAMPDMFFYHDSRIYVYYNKLKKHTLKESLFSNVNLCILNNETSTDTVFIDAKNITAEDLIAGGHQDVTI